MFKLKANINGQCTVSGGYDELGNSTLTESMNENFGRIIGGVPSSVCKQNTGECRMCPFEY